MTNEQAINKLNQCKQWYLDDTTVQAIDLGIKALKRSNTKVKYQIASNEFTLIEALELLESYLKVGSLCEFRTLKGELIAEDIIRSAMNRVFKPCNRWNIRR